MVDTPSAVTVGVVAAAASAVGTIGGLGGATILVPLLLRWGVPLREAAPLGLTCASASALAATPKQLAEGLVHHRLGVTLELAGSAGTAAGALVSSSVDQHAARVAVATLTILSAVVMRPRRRLTNPPDPTFSAEAAGEWPGTLAGSYHLGPGRVVPYRARRVPLATAAFALVGLQAGVSGIGGGFLRTPIMTAICRIPGRVAAATSSFTVGLSASSGLVVFAVQGRLGSDLVAPVLLGSMVGGHFGSVVQSRLPPAAMRAVLSVLLVAIGVLLLSGVS